MDLAKKITIEKMDWITREIVQANPNKVFLFGDNLMRVGMGGQAAAMRGEPNAFGIATKVTPGMKDEDFFSDEKIGLYKFLISLDFIRAIYGAKTRESVIVIPTDGLGTGLAEMPTRSPQLFKFLCDVISGMERSTA